MPKKRLDYLDMAKGVGIFLVVLGHIEYLSESAMRWIYSFHMPLFFVIGGILAYQKEPESPYMLKAQWRRRAKGILIPYASFSIMMLTMRVFELIFQPERITGGELLRQLVEAITGYGIHTLWFLPTYFLSGILFSLLLFRLRGRTGKHWRTGLGVLLSAALAIGLSKVFGVQEYTNRQESLLWYVGMDLLIVFLRVLAVQPFFWFGWLYARLREQGQTKGRLMLLGLLLLLAGGYLSLYNPALDLHYLYLQPWHYVAAAASSFGLLHLVRALPVSRVLSYLGRNSLVIMCTHAGMFVLYYVSLGMFFVRKLIPMTDLVLYISIAAVTCAAELPIIWIFNRYFKYLLGRT